ASCGSRSTARPPTSRRSHGHDRRQHRPILTHVQPLPGGLFAGDGYEKAISDLNLTVAELSAAISSAMGEEQTTTRR
ncbi:hypothetical protein VR41_10390, partial [Streptomyces sp. NRRL B-1568]